ncbi:translocase subunit [Olea europaea subsp. europaea]|uniref:Translocase subunit n=1 Tax=Olea europaea subsp. europaea TaxID=158383 RepID=A0A8S0QHN5_OLEEU|nr:translocase subunit [Olea europaea subsp. europaea]
MGFRALRSIIRPVCGSLLSTPTASHFFPATTSPSPLRQHRYLFGSFGCNLPWIPPSSAFHSLTDSRYPKRRPSDKPRRKRASLRPPGPYAWVKYLPGQPILPNQPNEGSVKRRNEKKRIKQHRAFILFCRLEQDTGMNFPAFKILDIFKMMMGPSQSQKY